MARAKRKRAAPKSKPIVFVLTPRQKKKLQSQGLLRNGAAAWVRARYRSGRLVVSRHRKAGKFVASNAAFA